MYENKNFILLSRSRKLFLLRLLPPPTHDDTSLCSLVHSKSLRSLNITLPWLSLWIPFAFAYTRHSLQSLLFSRFLLVASVVDKDVTVPAPLSCSNLICFSGGELSARLNFYESLARSLLVFFSLKVQRKFSYRTFFISSKQKKTFPASERWREKVFPTRLRQIFLARTGIGEKSLACTSTERAHTVGPI